ncbi:MAG: hypothetical protein SVN78_06240 [Deferribacterota bacterium]|nr:hypothetical protein [Deferribacterota bacterium]
MMKSIKGVITILLTLILTCPMILSNAYATRISEGSTKAYLMVALPENLALSQLDKTSLINLTEGGLDKLPIKGAKNMSYNKAVRSVESGELNNKALLFVYAPGVKGKAVQGSASTGQETASTATNGGIISRIIGFIRSLLGIETPEEEAPIEETGDLGGTEQGIGYMPPTEEGVTPPAEEEMTQAPDEEVVPPVAGEETTPPDEEGMTPPTEGEVDEATTGLLPPLEQPSEQPGEIEEVAEEEQAEETEEVAGEEQPGETEELAEEEQPSETEETAEEEQPGETEEVADNESEATIIPVQPVNPGGENTGESMTPMALQNLGKTLQQMGYRYTIIPFK